MATIRRTIHHGDVDRAPDAIGGALILLMADRNFLGCCFREQPRLHDSGRLRALRLRLLLEHLEETGARQPGHLGAASCVLHRDAGSAKRESTWAGRIASTITDYDGSGQTTAAPS